MTVEELSVQLVANNTKFIQAMKQSSDEVIGFEKTTAQSTQKVSKSFSMMKKAIIGLGIGAVIKKSVGDALNYIGNDTQFMSTMGAWSDEVANFTEDLKNKMGISRSEMRNFISTMYNMFQGMGIGEENSYKMSKSLSMLSQDMASFYNISASDALEKLQSGLAGNSMALRQLGIMIDDTTVKEYALSNGLQSNWETLAQSEKAMWRYNAVMEKTGFMQGYLANTINSPVTALRMLKDSVKTLSQTFGQLFIPVITATLPYLQALVKIATMGVEAIAKLFNIKIGTALTSELSKSSDKASSLGSNIQPVGDGINKASVGAGKMAKGVKEANKQADKLKRTLAGFDEMNVLKEDGSVGGIGSSLPNSVGGAGVGAGVGGSLPPIEIPVAEYPFEVLEGIQSKVDDIINNILKSFDKFKTINMQPLIDSFQNLITAVQPLGTIAVGVIQFFIDKVLYPLTKWTIESLLPSFFNLLTQAVKMLTPVLQVFIGVGVWLFDAFLNPIAKWTGALIINAMNTLAGAFKRVSESASALSGLVAVLGTLMAIKVGGWFASIGGVLSGNIKDTESLTKAQKGLVGILNPVVELYKKYNTKLVESKGVLSLLKAPSDAVGGSFSKLGTIVSTLGDKMKLGNDKFKAYNKLFDELQGQEKPTSSAFQKIGSVIETFYNKTIKSATNSVQEFASKTKENIDKAGGGFNGFAKVVASGATSVAGSILNGIGGAFQNLGAIISANPLGALITVFSLLMNSSEQFRQVLQNLISSALEPIGKVVGVIFQAFQPLINMLSGALVSVLTALVPLFELLGTVIAGLMKPIEIIAGGISWLVGKIGGLFGMQTDTNIQDNMKLIDDAVEEVNTSTKDLTKTWDDNLKTLEKNGQGNSELAKTYQMAKKEINEVDQAVQDAIRTHGKDEETVNQIKEEYNRYKDSLSKAVDKQAELQELERNHAKTKIDYFDAVKKQKEAQDLHNDAVQKAGTTYEDVNKKIGDNIENYNKLTPAEKLVLETGEAVADVNMRVAETQDAVNDGAKKIAEGNSQVASSSNDMKQARTKINDVLEGNICRINDVGTATENLNASTQKNNAGISSSVKKTTTDSIKWWQNYTKEVGTGTSKAYDSANKSVKGAEAQSKKSIDSMKNDTKTYVSQTKTELDKNKTNYANTNKAIETDTKKSIDEMNKSIKTNSDEWTKSLNKIKSTAQTVFNEVKNLANSMRDSLMNTLKSIGNEGNTQFTKVGNAGKTGMNTVKSTWSGLQSWFKTLFNGIYSDMTKAFTNVGTKFKSIANQMIQPVGKAINGVVSGMNHLSKTMGAGASFKSWAIPKYEKGSKGLAQDTIAMVNDQRGPKYKELILEPNGNAFIPEKRNTILPLKKGTKILPANKTDEWLKNIPKFKTGIGDFVKGWDKGLTFKKGKLEMAKNPTHSVQVGINQKTDLGGAPFNKIIANGVKNKLLNDMVKWFKKTFPVSKFEDGIDVSGFLKVFIDKYKGKWVDAFGKIGNVGNGGGPNFSGQCASLATSWIQQAFGYWYSGNGNSYGASGRRIGKQDAKPGDIIYWAGGPYGHVGVYTGGGKVFEQNNPIAGKARIGTGLGMGTAQFARPRGTMKNVPKLERGAIVEEQTFAMVGENGTEAIMPLEKNLGWIDKLAGMIDERQDNKKVDTNQPIHIVVNVGEDNLIDKVIDGVNDEIFRNNKMVFNI